MKPTEEWRAVPGLEGRYEVSSIGRVRSTADVFRGGKVLKPVLVRNYEVVNLYGAGGVRHQTKVHRIVCAAFHGPRPFAGAVVRHLNGNSRDNAATNLAWGTFTENNNDTVDHGRNQNARRDRCARGHEYTAENTRLVVGQSGRMNRQCRACGRIWATSARNARRALLTGS